MFTLLGIPNCDQVRKARKYLETKAIAYQFRDIRKEPLSATEWGELIEQDQAGTLINTRSPSFRKTGFKAADLNDQTKLEALLAQPTAMKRPLLRQGKTLLAVGFDPAVIDQVLVDGES